MSNIVRLHKHSNEAPVKVSGATAQHRHRSVVFQKPLVAKLTVFISSDYKEGLCNSAGLLGVHISVVKKKKKKNPSGSVLLCIVFLPTEANGGPVKRKGQGQSRGLAVAETGS